MTLERLNPEERKLIPLTCAEGEVEMYIGQVFSLFGKDGFVLEGETGEKLKSSNDRMTPVLLVSFSKGKLLDWSLPKAKNTGGRDLYEVCGDNVASSVLEQRGKDQE